VWQPLLCGHRDGCGLEAVVVLDGLALGLFGVELGKRAQRSPAGRFHSDRPGVCVEHWCDVRPTAPLRSIGWGERYDGAGRRRGQQKLGGGETKEAQHARRGNARGARPGVGRARGGVASSEVVTAPVKAGEGAARLRALAAATGRPCCPARGCLELQGHKGPHAPGLGKDGRLKDAGKGRNAP
jgi:hypothetical protein